MKKQKPFRSILAMLLTLSMVLGCMSGLVTVSAETGSGSTTNEVMQTSEAQEAVNLALNKPVTVSGLEVEGKLLGEMAVDGDASTRWSASAATDQQWMVVDLGEVQNINEVSILFRECPQYQVLVSKDGETYDVVGEITNGTHGLADKTQVFTFDTVEARYVKFLQLQKRNVQGTFYGVTIWEFEVYDRAENNNDQGNEGTEEGGSQDGEITYYDVNLALNKNTEVSACEVDWLPGEYAVDGSRDTRWSAHPSEDQQWIIVDLGDVYNINEVFVYYQEPPKMLIQVSTDGENYTTVYEWNDGIPSGDSVERTFTFAMTEARYVKLLQLERRNTNVGVYSMGVWEMEVYCREVIDYADHNLALSKPVTYSGAEVDWLPGEYAVDGDRNTRWSASPNSDDQWLIVDLGKVYSINQVYLYGMEAPRYQILVSTDGEDYTLAVDVTDGVSSLDSIERTFNFETVKARYVKLQQLERRNTAYGLYSNVLWEFEVYYKVRNNYNSITDIQHIAPEISEDGTKLILPEINKEGYEVQLYGSSNEAVVALDGSIHAPLEDKKVTMMYQIVNENDPSDAEIAEKEVEITIPGKYQKEENDNQKPDVLPAIQEWKGYEGTFALTDASKLVLGDESLKETAEMINYYFEEMLGRTLEVTEGTPAAGDIYLTLGSKDELGEEGYEIEIADTVKVEAYETKGVLYAGTTMTQILMQSEGKDSMPKGLIRDYPAYEVRSVMFDVARFYMPINYLEEISKYMAFYKCNEIHVHINDDGGEQNSCFRIESKLYPEINSGNADGKVYTQEEYKAYQKEVAKYGIKVVTELDSPSHTGYVAFHDSSMMLDVNHMDIRNEEAVAFIKKVIDELLDGEDPVIQSDTFHVGCDEYFRYDAGRFAEYRDEVPYYEKEISDYVMSKGYNCRMWNMLGSNVYPGVGIVSTDVVMNYFAPYQANYKETWAAGYAAINSYADYLYIVPEVGYANNTSLSSLYQSWDVNNFGSGFVVPKSSPLLLGAAPCFWYDIKVGTSEFDVYHAMKKEIVLLAEKTWYGAATPDQSTENFLERVEKLSVYAPGANPARFVESADEIVAGYDFETVDGTIVKDASSNAYDAVAENLAIEADGENHYAALDGNGYLTLPFDSLGYPYTVEFDLYIDEETPENAVFFDGADGTLYLNYDGTGKIGYERKYYAYTFDYAIEYGKWTHFTITCDGTRTKLFVDYSAVGTGTYYKVTASKEASSTFVLPVEKVGAGVTGGLDNLVLYDEVLKVKDPNNKNLALNKPVQVSGCEVDYLPGEDAVDGDDTTRWSCSPDTDEQWIIVDMEDVYTIDKIHFYFLEAPKYQILVSTDGEHYELVKDVTDGVSSLDSITRTFTFDPVEARYVKILQTERRNTAYGLYGMVIWEMEIYEKEPEIFQIVKQPESVSVQKGQDAVVHVEATGEGLTYKWYYKNPGNKKFYDSGADFVSEDGASYIIPMAAWRDGQEVYCVITDANGDTLQTNTVVLTMDNGSIQIVKQPESVMVDTLGDEAVVTVEATGEGLTYQWYYKNPGNVKFYASGTDFVSEDGASYTISVAKWRDGQEVYCVITDANGVSVQTNTVTLSAAK